MREVVHKLPFIMLVYSLLFSICRHYEWYHHSFIVLSDTLGYSLLTSLMMLYFYRNYCLSVKICIYGLISLNIFNILYSILSISGYIYNIYLITIIFAILINKSITDANPNS